MKSHLHSKTVICLLVMLMLSGYLTSCTNGGGLHFPIVESFLENPHMNYPYYYKGQIHVHTSEGADGEFSPTWVETEYRNKGYTFISLTDHNEITDLEPPIGCDNDGHCILHIPGEENGNLCPNHILVIGIDLDRLGCDPNNKECDSDLVCDRIIDPNCNGVPDGPSDENVQEGIDYLNSVQEISLLNVHGLSGGKAQCTDASSGTWPISDLLNTHDYTGMLILNGTNWSGYPRWDAVLSQGRDRRTWAAAGDDFETGGCFIYGVPQPGYYCPQNPASNPDSIYGQLENSFNRGWIVVNSSIGPAEDYIGTSREDELRQDILTNIKLGNFYAVVRSPEIKGDTFVGMGTDDIGPQLQVKVVGSIVTVETDQVSDEIRFLYTNVEQIRVCATNQANDDIVCHTERSKGVYKSNNVQSASYTVPETAMYVRVEIDQHRNGILYTAYSQPLYFLTQGYEGMVTDPQTGNGIPYVKLTFVSQDYNDTIINEGGRITVVGETDNRGWYHIRLPKGIYMVSASHPDYNDFSSAPGFWEVGENFQNGPIYMSKIVSVTPTVQSP